MERDWTSIDNRLNDPLWYRERAEFLAAYRLLRDEDPVHWAKDEAYGRSFWFLTRHEHVKQALGDHMTFSSRHLWTVGRPPRSPRRFTLEQRYELGLEARVVNVDPPIHTYLRRPMNRYFSVPSIAKLTDQIQRYSDEVVDRARGLEKFDLVEEVAAQLPVRVILGMLGVPEEDWALVRNAAGMYTQSHDPRFLVDDDPVKTAETGLRQLIDYAMDLAEERKREPRDDFATVVTEMKIEGEKLSTYELRGWFSALILGGIETSRNAISAGLWQLLVHPDQREIFLSAPAGRALDLVDEVIRWTSPARSLLRVATRDVEMGGKEIRQGDWVLLSLISANHDERVFEDPGRFDLRRDPVDHVGLGDGIHKCLGRNLLRLEFTTLARTLLQAFPDMSCAGEPTWMLDVNGSGLASLEVRPYAAA
ncbi:cytochrome P450 [Pseudofrankia inefficax]|uniref:Cytochrome P450 n=1 Tax=Pseudofrankia inefficax (strain DSM 45817 / CECT 9037 / DDB 130130 / EuI1c) TaxID=298654 RepID=E3IU46_PSEI1|nr:cytochrome P450 [Pseudofrankia inefficax]ADP81239.1 cytochrome P450 [Pseudofrankia inefficax]